MRWSSSGTATGTIHAVDARRHVTEGRLRRLTEELLEEQLGAVEASSVPEVLVDEIDFALRPPRHERRVPSYGAFVLPTSHPAEWSNETDLTVFSAETTERDDGEVRRYADGLTSWIVRTAEGVDRILVFDRAAGSERDLVVLARASGAMVVQRHPSGEVRLVGSFGVARWDGLDWHVERPVAAWLSAASCGLDAFHSEAVDRLLQFAVHDLGSAGIGAILVYHPVSPAGERLEHRLRAPAPLRIDRATALGPLRHVLSQTDGAAIFNGDGQLIEIGARLAPSADAQLQVDPIGGTRHTSARRYSFDEPEALVVAVSDDGPVTVFRNGGIVGRSGTRSHIVLRPEGD